MPKKLNIYTLINWTTIPAAIIALVFYSYQTFSPLTELTIANMSHKEVIAFEQLSSIRADMSVRQVYGIMGEPHSELYWMARWNGFGGSALSQARIYFADGRPTKVRWIKLGSFIYDAPL